MESELKFHAHRSESFKFYWEQAVSVSVLVQISVCAPAGRRMSMSGFASEFQLRPNITSCAHAACFSPAHQATCLFFPDIQARHPCSGGGRVSRSTTKKEKSRRCRRSSRATRNPVTKSLVSTESAREFA